MLTHLIDTPLGNFLVNRLIARAKCTPYFHLFHDDGTPYMERYWLVRIGMPKGWREIEREIEVLRDSIATSKDSILSQIMVRTWSARLRDLELKLVPKFGLRIHRIMSSDVPVFHDHPWDFWSLILRTGYREITPDWSHGPTPAHITVSDDYDGHMPVTYTHVLQQFHPPGTLLHRKATDWHYLQLRAGEEAWTLVLTSQKRQGWGFLVDGLIKVPWRTYIEARRRWNARARGEATA